MNKGLRFVAILEGTKGLIALIAGFEIHRLANENVHNFIESLARHLHLNPASQFTGAIYNELDKLTYSNLSLIAIGCLVYSIVRFVEAFGLWNEYKWLEWFALVSGAIYIPFELYELMNKFGALSLIVLIVNVIVVAYLYFIVRSKTDRSTQS